MKKVFIISICILLSIFLLIYHWALQQIWQTDEPRWQILKLKEAMANSKNIILDIRLDRARISLNERFTIIASIKNNSTETYYFGEKWFESSDIGTNMYDINKKKFICDYSASRSGSYLKKNKKYFLLKPKEIKEFRKTLVLRKGFLLLWKLFPCYNYYLYDGNNTYIVLKGKKTIFIRVFYHDHLGDDELEDIKVFKDHILSNEIKINIK